MIPASRRAPSALRALAFAATPSRCIRRPVLPRLPSQIKCIIPQSRRCFSSMYPRFQEAAAQELQEDAGQQEYTQFEELAQHGLISPRVIETLTQRMNIHTMTDVQRMTLNHCLDGSDVIAQARTGTGKTLAFLMPIVQRILRDKNLENTSRNRASVGDIRALIITPTRELAEQIAVEAKKIVANTSVKVQTAVGGTQKSMHLRQMQNQGCHILVGTPGRVQDIISDRSTGVSLDNIETFVLDEADRLLDIGFAPAIAEIQTFMPPRHEKNRQTLMFSATVPKSVVQLVRETLRPDFKFIRTVDPNEAPTHARIPQKVVFGRGLQNQIPIIMEIAYNAIQAHKKDPSNQMPFKAIVYFGSTAEVAMAFDAFSKMRDPEMPRSIFQPHPLDPCRIFQMHGKLAQAQRTRETDGFRRAQSGLLFSSDVTARGMDFPDVSHIIQIGLPKSSDDYVHRLGRTGRAGKNGEGWLILNEDERREINYKMRNSGINLTDAELVTASLDMTRGAQIPGHIAKLLKYVEVGVKSVSYNVKAATYQALLGVLPQQNPNRPKAQQVELMNELAKFGWGMQEPPPIARNLAAKIGILNVPGVRLDDGPQRRDDRDGGRGGFGGRGGYGGRGGFGDRGGFSDRGDGGRDGGRFNDRAPSSQEAGRGVFGGGSRGGDAFDQLGLGGGEDRRGGGRGGRGGGRDSGRGGGSRGGRSRF